MTPRKFLVDRVIFIALRRVLSAGDNPFPLKLALDDTEDTLQFEVSEEEGTLNLSVARFDTWEVLRMQGAGPLPLPVTKTQEAWIRSILAMAMPFPGNDMAALQQLLRSRPLPEVF